MQNLWKQKLEQLKLSEDQLSVRIKKIIKVYKDSVAELEELNKKLVGDGLTDSRKTKLAKAKEQGEQDLSALDEAIVKDIEKWNRNKDTYAALSKQLVGKRGKKNVVAPKPVPAPAVVPATEPAPAQTDPDPEPAPVPTPVPVPVKNPDPVTEPVKTKTEPGLDPEKKKTHWGWWVLGGVAAALGLGALIHIANKD